MEMADMVDAGEGERQGTEGETGSRMSDET